MSGWAGCFLTGKHGLYSDMFWTPLIAQALAVERKKDSEMAGRKVFRHFIQLIQLIRYFYRILVKDFMRTGPSALYGHRAPQWQVRHAVTVMVPRYNIPSIA